MRETVLEWVAREKVVAIVRGAESSVCTRVAEALYAGGIRLMEITYDQRSPESWEDTAAAIGQTAALKEECWWGRERLRSPVWWS